MNKRSYARFLTGKTLLLSILVYVVVFFAAGCSGLASTQEKEEEGSAEAPADRPNIIFVLTDDLDRDTAKKMPSIQSLIADSGMKLERSYVSWPTCCPSRATTLTGLYAHNHEVIENDGSNGGWQKFWDEGHEENTIAVALHQAGYRTGLFGKYLNNYDGRDSSSIPPGWDEWHAKVKKGGYYHSGLNENGQLVTYGSDAEDYQTDVLSRKANDFVSTAATEGQPFFAYVSVHAPHRPYTAALRHEGEFAGEQAPRAPESPAFNESDVSDKPSWIQETKSFAEGRIEAIDQRYQQRSESMLAVDELVASLINELESAGALENTYIFFTSDNGFFQGEHRIPQQKRYPYEEAAGVPLFVRGPEVAAGSTTDKLALNTDLAPTFGELAGVEFPADGRSLLPLFRGESSPWRTSILLEGYEGEELPESYQALVTESHKYVEYDNGEKELYDLVDDPYEMESLHESADPSLVEDLKARLEELRSCSEQGCEEAEDAP